MVKEVRKCVSNKGPLGPVFKRWLKKLNIYVVYCQNKNKSEYIVQQYLNSYFEVSIWLNIFMVKKGLIFVQFLKFSRCDCHKIMLMKLNWLSFDFNLNVKIQFLLPMASFDQHNQILINPLIKPNNNWNQGTI